MSRFDLTPLDLSTLDAARQTLADAESVNLLDGSAMACMIGRLEVAVKRLIEMVDETDGGNVVRCPAAHPEDPTPCGGPVVVTIIDAENAGADGCEHHAARMLASIIGARPVAKPDAPAGVAVRIFRTAHHTHPFPWLGGRS
ncbi:hypothetical protein SAMN06272771_3885 [Streptomyces sp. Ag82_O1-12]|uniref:hypothetical protein n=1 Tax=unclassified Streptomyces TaxID=2593676 RepID=UPI000BC77D37|nr:MULTISPECIES: hypothetical protein [unclassified Streptomyces]SMQ17469.1 hypothetical protein SAMN06272771_3885 [Streptomyces sp. Ag82_O1-12]SOD46504.1 hypothetical protein SAMN06272727_3884 [Streptomyces sp. Ag82_G6-1]